MRPHLPARLQALSIEGEGLRSRLAALEAQPARALAAAPAEAAAAAAPPQEAPQQPAAAAPAATATGAERAAEGTTPAGVSAVEAEVQEDLRAQVARLQVGGHGCSSMCSLHALLATVPGADIMALKCLHGRQEEAAVRPVHPVHKRARIGGVGVAVGV